MLHKKTHLILTSYKHISPYFFFNSGDQSLYLSCFTFSSQWWLFCSCEVEPRDLMTTVCFHRLSHYLQNHSSAATMLTYQICQLVPWFHTQMHFNFWNIHHILVNKDVRYKVCMSCAIFDRRFFRAFRCYLKFCGQQLISI
jgi:hypothetical protein